MDTILLDGNLSLGGAFKIQRHSLAGYSGSGFGLDLGFWTRPLALAGNESAFGRGLALGLALRNAIEPEIKLELDAVPDPSAMRAGLAWSGDLAKDVEVLACDGPVKTPAGWTADFTPELKSGFSGSWLCASVQPRAT